MPEVDYPAVLALLAAINAGDRTAFFAARPDYCQASADRRVQ